MLEAEISELRLKADDVAAKLRALGNDKRLLILCKLVEAGEMNVTRLAGEVGLSQSALSQHLAKMRADGIVMTRRDSQTIYYAVSDKRMEQLVGSLYQIFCKGPQ